MDGLRELPDETRTSTAASTHAPVDLPSIQFELISSSFCGACSQTRAVLEHVARMLPTAQLHERNVAKSPEIISELDISTTPTVIVRDASGLETMRAEGVPTIQHLLVAAERTMHPGEQASNPQAAVS